MCGWHEGKSEESEVGLPGSAASALLLAPDTDGTDSGREIKIKADNYLGVFSLFQCSHHFS